MVRPEGVEPPTYWFVASCSIQLSYGRTLQRSNLIRIPDWGDEDKPPLWRLSLRFGVRIVRIRLLEFGLAPVRGPAG